MASVMFYSAIPSIIQALGAIVGAAVGAVVASKIANRRIIYRNDIARLVKEVEAYHEHEGNLVRKLKEPMCNDANLSNHRGNLRKKLTPHNYPKLTPSEISKMREKYLTSTDGT